MFLIKLLHPWNLWIFSCTSPLHLRDEARLEAAARLQQLGGLAVEQQLFVRQLHQDESDQLAHVLPADQFLVTAGGKKKKNTSL